MKLSPMARWNLGRIIPFGVIWLLIGLVFILVETAAMGTSKPVSPTIINLTSAVIIFASIAVTIVGLLVGCVEIIFIENLFRKKSFLQKDRIQVSSLHFDDAIDYFHHLSDCCQF